MATWGAFAGATFFYKNRDKLGYVCTLYFFRAFLYGETFTQTTIIKGSSRHSTIRLNASLIEYLFKANHNQFIFTKKKSFLMNCPSDESLSDPSKWTNQRTFRAHCG